MVGDNAPSELPKCKTGKCVEIKADILVPHYPAVEKQKVLIVKQEVSNLKKKNFVIQEEEK